jgi:hypothetical protein
MVVIAHEAVGMAYPTISFIDPLKDVEEVPAVVDVLEYGLLLVSTRGDVIHGTGIFYT